MCPWGTAGGNVHYKCTTSESRHCVYLLNSYTKHVRHVDAAIGCTAGSWWPVGWFVASLQGVARWAPHAADMHGRTSIYLSDCLLPGCSVAYQNST